MTVGLRDGSTKLLTVDIPTCRRAEPPLANEISAKAGQLGGHRRRTTFLHATARIQWELIDGESSALVGVPGYLSRKIHFFFYRHAAVVLRQDWDLVHAWEEPYIVLRLADRALDPKSVPLVFSTAKTSRSAILLLSRSSSAVWCNEARVGSPFGETVEQVCRTRPGYGDRPAKTIPMGVDTADFAPNLESGRRVIEHLEWSSNGPPVVDTWGDSSPKGPPLLMRALDDCRSPWRALSCGGGPMEDDIKVWGRRHGDRVRVCNGVSHEQVPAYLNAMVSSSRDQTTHFLARAVRPHAHRGLRVRDSGHRQRFRRDPLHGRRRRKNRREHDQAGWRQALEDVLESPSKRAEMAARGRERASQLFSWPVVARRHLEFFRPGPCLSPTPS